MDVRLPEPETQADKACDSDQLAGLSRQPHPASYRSQPIAEVNNTSMRTLVGVLVGKGLSPQSIKHICLPVKKVKASVMDDGDELYPI